MKIQWGAIGGRRAGRWGRSVSRLGRYVRPKSTIGIPCGGLRPAMLSDTYWVHEKLYTSHICRFRGVGASTEGACRMTMVRPVKVRTAILAVALTAVGVLRAADVPELTCDAPVFDFGTLSSSQVVAHTFFLRNAGTATALITRVHTTCRCTVAEPARRLIPPGATESVAVRFDLHGRRSAQNRPIYINWNGTTNTVLRLSLVGTVIGVEAAKTPEEDVREPTSRP